MNCVESEVLKRDEAVLRLPQSGQLYRHYKGGLYRVDDLATLEADLCPAVLYRSLYPREKARRWIRPLSDFQAEVAPGVPRFSALREVNLSSLRHYLPYRIITDAALEEVLSNYDQSWRIFHSRRYVLSLFWYAKQNGVALSLEQSLALLLGEVVWIPGIPQEQCQELSASLSSHWFYLLGNTSELDSLTLMSLLWPAKPTEKAHPGRAIIEDLRLCYLADDWLHFDSALEMQWLQSKQATQRPSTAERKHWRWQKSQELGRLLAKKSIFSPSLKHLNQQARDNILALVRETATTATEDT
jgi:hypothetical protein